MLMLTRRANVLAAVGVAVALGGCAADAPDLASHDFRLRHPVTVEAAMAALSVEAPAGAAGLAAEDYGRMDRFVADYEKRGEGIVDVAVTATGPDDEAASGFARALATELARRGVPSERMTIRLLYGDGGQPKSAMMTYRQYVARVPECGSFPASSTRNYANEQSPNFGCSVQRNIGLMVADPRDLERMRTAEDADAGRSGDVVAKYRLGEATVSANKVETTIISGPK